MRFLHTSNIHYGATPDAGKPWAKEREQAVKDCFERIIRRCQRDEPDYLFIAGNLFDGVPTDDEYREVNAAFASIPQTKVVIIRGKGESLFSYNCIAAFPWNENVSIIKEDIFLEEKYRILVTSRDVSEISDRSSYKYIALGGSHKPSSLIDGNAACAGAPEALSREDTGKHGYYIGRIDEEQKRLASLKFVSYPSTGYISLAVNITPETESIDLTKNLLREMQKRGDNNIYQIRLKGSCRPEAKYDFSTVTSRFRISSIIDQTEPEYDYAELYEKHAGDMVGLFIKEMDSGSKSRLQKKAFEYGINALLKTADERKQNEIS